MSLPPSNGKTLLITGVNGYIASTLGMLILDKGYHLRGICRSAASAEALLLGAYSRYKSRVQIIEVPDMTVDGAFDKVVAGVHGIFHTASPADMACDTFEKMVTPAVRGTENILQSAHAYGGPQLASVVITSSVSAVHNANLPSDRDYTFDESDFAPADLDLLKSNDAAKIPNSIFQLYIASKVTSEAFAWSFHTTRKPNFSISTIQPGNVIGPPVQPPKTAAKLNETLKPVWGIFSGSISELSPVSPSSSYVDVRDVALMHLWACENGEKADGERFIAVAGAGPTQAIVDILREAYPDRLKVMPEGVPGVGYTGWKDGKVGEVGWVSGRIRISGQKAQTVMGLEWIPIKKSVTDTAKVLEMYL